MSRRNLVLIVTWALIALFLQFRANYDVDVFWRLKTGQLMLERGELIRSDPFTATHADQPVATPTWGSEVVWALLYRIGSWRLLHQVNALLFAGAFLIAALTARQHEISAFAGVLGLSLGVLVGLPYCEIRPNTFAIFGFALLLFVAQLEMPARRKLVLAAVVLLVWQNMHPSVMFAAVVLAARAGAGWLRLLGDRRAAKPWFLTVLALLTAVSTLATPAGPAIFASSAFNAQIARELGVSEWMPIWHPVLCNAGAWSIWVVLGVSLLLLAGVWPRVRLEDLATFFVLAAMTLPVHRLSLFLAVGMVPVWSRWIMLVWFSDSPAPGADATVRPVGATAIAAAAVLCAVFVPRMLRARVFDPQLPLAGAQRLRELGVRGVIYNYREWAGPLIWTGYPEWKVTIDGRLYLFTRKEWQLYHQIALGRVAVAEVEREYEPAAFFLRPSYHEGFIRLLRKSARWEEAYADEMCVVFIRRGESKGSEDLRALGAKPGLSYDDWAAPARGWRPAEVTRAAPKESYSHTCARTLEQFPG